MSKEKSIIYAFVDRSNEARHSKAVQLLFYGKPSNGTYLENIYVQSIKKAVRLCYSDKKYRGRFTDIYDTFVSLFYPYLLTKSERLLGIETTLAGYLFVSAKNFANSSRGQIDASIGIIDPAALLELDRSIDAMVAKENEDGRYNSNENIIDQPEAESFWAESLINKYLDQISHENYRAVIRAVVLEGMSREDFAEESGISYTAVNLLLNHAMTSLTTVALQDIRWRSKKSYTNYIHLIKDDKDRMLLKDYFENNIYNNGLALAVRRLIKISIREMKEQEAEERRASRSHQN